MNKLLKIYLHQTHRVFTWKVITITHEVVIPDLLLPCALDDADTSILIFNVRDSIKVGVVTDLKSLVKSQLQTQWVL